MGLERIAQDQLAVAVVVLTLVFRDGLIPALAEVRRAVLGQVYQPDDGHASERVRHPLQDLVAVEREQDRFVRAARAASGHSSAARPQPMSPGSSGSIALPDLVAIEAVGRVDVLADQALAVTPRRVQAPPDHVLGQDVGCHATVESQPQLVGAGGDLLPGRRLGMIQADVEAAQHQEQRRDRLAHPVVHRRAAAVHVPPPRRQVVRAFPVHLLVVHLAQVHLDGLGDELGDGRTAAAVLVVVVLRRRGRVGADHPRIGSVADVLRLGVDRTHEPREPLVDVGVHLGVGVLLLVTEEVAGRQPPAVGAVDGVAIPLAPLERVEQPSPSDLMLDPVDMPAMHDQLAVEVRVGRRLRPGTGRVGVDRGAAAPAGTLAGQRSRRSREPVQRHGI